MFFDLAGPSDHRTPCHYQGWVKNWIGGERIMNESDRMVILNQLENGEINTEQALQALGADQEPYADSDKRGSSDQTSRRRAWWLVPFSLGIAGAAAGMGLSQLGGLWWVCAGPLLVASLLVVILSVVTSQSLWVDLRVRTSTPRGARKINLSLPLPINLTAWALQVFGNNIPGLDQTSVDELILGLEGNLSPETPIQIEIHEEEDGEHVEVFMG